ncbi:MAG: S41 family peptidase [Bacteroidota bacterium]
MRSMMKLWAPVLFVVTGTFVQAQQPKKETNNIEKFSTLYNYISQWYVDSVNTDKLVDDAIRSMLEELDPHSIYIPKEEVDEMNAPLKGNFEGIGIRFQIMKDTIMVVNTIPGGPSEKIGVKAGDKIIKIEDKVVAGVGIKNSNVREHLLGQKGTKVTIEVKRRNEKKNPVFTITRDKIPIYSIDAAYMATDEIGYIKLSSFGETTMSEFFVAIDTLKKQGMKSLIFDLQGNGGGLLQTAIDLSDEFLDQNKLIVYTEGRSFERRDTYTRRTGNFESGKLILLIDESSASASEILSGAVQDWDRGLIVGRRSFGKGLVQKPITLPDGSQVRLTTQRYFTPTGRCIQKPYEEGSEAYHKEKYQRFLSGEMMHKDSIKIPDSLKFETRVTKREVFGGGGIIPDIFVPIDTTDNSDYLDALIRKGVFNDFCLEYVDDNRNKMKKSYPNFKKFKSDFKVDKAVVEEFKTFAEKEGVKFNEKDYETSKTIIHARIKAGIAQNIWDYPCFYEIINEINPIYMKAIESIEDDTFKKMKLAANY